ncbi:hypothetical protein LIER_19765 [Lithospermum erythrorhizon]|uniref:RRP12-like protein n=1 Tax=Lithospermum erythrorhizon TaxID=34254 RepID=A0AAV3QLM6_LITER
MQEPPSSGDFCSMVLSQFSKTTTTNEHHLHICTAIGALSQTLKDQHIPLTPLSYFSGTCNSLKKVATDPRPPPHLIDAFCAILGLVFDVVGGVVLRRKFDELVEIVGCVLNCGVVGENGLVPILKCVRVLICVREEIEWGEIEKLYVVLLKYMAHDVTKVALVWFIVALGGVEWCEIEYLFVVIFKYMAHDVKVRKQSHSCLREVLQYFHQSPVLERLLGPASDSINKEFESSMLFSEPSKLLSAKKILYILDALKLCLPSMSLISTTNILKHFKPLLELKQPLVTKRITDALGAICNHPAAKVSSEVLLDLLCSLAALLSAGESSADSMTFTARLLDVGMKRVYSLNRQICVVKLPLVFNALSDVLASEHEESVVAAVGSFKSLINGCVDELVIKQGVDQFIKNNDAEARKLVPTVIGKVCATIESLLGYHYAAVWDMSFQVVSTMFDKLGVYSSYFLKGTIKSLADMQNLSDEDFSFRKQLHDCIGSAVGAVGPETFLTILPLKLDAQDLSEANLWVLPILKRHIVGAHLSFFIESIPPMIEAMKKQSAMLEQEGKVYSARVVDGIIYSLWSLLPSFCNYPVDTAESFKDIGKTLCSTLREESDVRGIVCSSLLILIQQNKSIVEGKEEVINERSVSVERAISKYTPEIAAQNLAVLRSSARELFSVISGVLYSSSKDATGPLQKTLGELASISDKAVVSWFFKITMKKLLKVTLEAHKPENSSSSNSMQVDNSSSENSSSSSRASLLGLAASLLPGLDSKEIDLLFNAVTPALKDDEGLIQKKAYKVLSSILQRSSEYISTKLEKLQNLMIDTLPSCHFSAKRCRLDCLYFLIVHVLKEVSGQSRHDVIASFLTEIVLALKEANKKTRNRAYDILVEIGHACVDDENNGDNQALLEIFNMVAGGLAGETSHMVSAAVKGLARLAYEFTDLISATYNLLPLTFLLIRRKNREIIKANLGLLKVLVAKSQVQNLNTHLKSLVDGLLNWQDSAKNHFKAKIKLLIEMLVKKCGMDAVKEVMPEEHLKLLTNIRKLKERRERKLAAGSVDSRSLLSKATTSRHSRWNHTRIFSDSGDESADNSEEDFMDAETISGRRSKSTRLNSKASSIRPRRTRAAAKSLQDDYFDQVDDEPLDLLDRQRTRSALRSSELQKRKRDSDDDLEVDSEGRLVIHEEGEVPKKKTSFNADSDDRSQAEESSASKGSRKAQKRIKQSESGWSYTGNEYASKKASGDVKRKGKFEPYAYWPLDRKMVSRRPEHRAAARKGMSSVVKLSKKLEGKSVANALALHRMKFKKNKGSKKSK